LQDVQQPVGPLRDLNFVGSAGCFPGVRATVRMDARSDNDISALTTDVEAREPFDGIAYLFSVFE